jgi:DNA-binding response OmpR family regulator
MPERDGSVLVVDDELDISEVIQLTLAEAGYTVRIAADGWEALERVAEDMPGLILLDMRMPGLDGWGFAREFRARHDHAAPIVVVAAAESAERLAREIQADGVLAKPFLMQDLLHVVEANLGAASERPRPDPGG